MTQPLNRVKEWEQRRDEAKRTQQLQQLLN